MRFLHGYLEKIGKYHVFLRNWIAGFRGVKLMDFSRALDIIKGSPTFFAGTQQKPKGLNGWERWG